MPTYLADTPICLVCVLRKSDLNLAGLPLLENRPFWHRKQSYSYQRGKRDYSVTHRYN